MSHILIVSGSPARVSRTAYLASEAARRLQSLGHSVACINVRELPATALLHADFSDPAIVEATEQIAQADALVLATPVYKAAYSGVLKAFLDVLPQKALRDKTVLSIASGGSLAHLLSLDYALRPVLAALHATHTVANVYAVEAEMPKDAQGVYTIGDALETRLDASLHELSLRLGERHELRWFRERYPHDMRDAARAAA